MTSVALRTTLLLAAILYRCDGQGYDQWFTDFPCAEFADLEESQCTALTAVDNLYHRDIRGVHYFAATSGSPNIPCSYNDFEPAISLTGDFDKLFGYVYATLYNSTSKTYLEPLKGNWIQTAYGRARSLFQGETADQVIVARTAHGHAWARCAQYDSTSDVPVCYISTKERHPDVAVVRELEQLAFAAGFTLPFYAVSQQDCPPAIGRRGPTVITLDLPFF